MKNKKQKQAIGQKFSLFLNEFKALAVLDSETEQWDWETQELIDYLCYQWNEWCLNNGFFAHGRLLLVEIKTMRVCILNKKNGIDENTKVIRDRILKERNKA